MFGKAPIRFKKDDKYYHGVDPYTIHDWKMKEKEAGCVFHYTNKERTLPHQLWDTHNIQGFCSDCSYDTELNKNKKKVFTYRCNGHGV
jgi:hypothetical protein